MSKIRLTIVTLIWSTGVMAEWRDPTIPGNLPIISQEVKSNGETALTLSAILVTETGRYAIINGKTIRAGSFLDSDTRILKIMPNYVLIRQHETTQKLHLVPSVKKPLK